jgi:hypothetical protein
MSGGSVLSPRRSRRTRRQSVQEEESPRTANKLGLGSAEAAENAGRFPDSLLNSLQA